MEINVEHLGAVQFEIHAGKHTIVCDQPTESGGFDEGVTPPDLLLASLGSCAAYYAADYLRKRNLASKGTRVRVSADKLKSPARMDHFQICVEVPIDMTSEHKAGIERAVHQCLIHNTLQHPPEIALQVTSTEAAALAGELSEFACAADWES